MMSPLVVISVLLFLTSLFFSPRLAVGAEVDFFSSSLESLSPPSTSPVLSVVVDHDGGSTSFPMDAGVMLGDLPPSALASVEGVVEDYVPPSSPHSFKTMQSSTAVFTMERMTAVAPWSGRIQPALLYQREPVLYRNWQSNVQVSTGDHWLLMYEGSLSRATADTETANENDVWASMDDGITWDLIAGISRYGSSGLVYSRSPNSSFTPRGGSSNCEDPASDRIYSVAGYRYNITQGRNLGMYGTTQVFSSTNGKNWQQFGNQQTWPQPNRYFSSCDVDVNGHVYSMGGITIAANGVQSLLNDVWSTAQGGWARIATAPWAPRAEHLTLIASNTPLGREVIYVIGGHTSWQNNGAVATNSNDVWASSDGGATWKNLVPNGKAGHLYARWGHAGVITEAGVIVLFGGSNSPDGTYYNTYSYRDVWASFDGGYNWQSCQLPEGPDAARQFIRTEQGVTINREGKMIIATGYSFDPENHVRFDYRDVWRTPFSVEDTATLASMCGGQSVIPKAGPGIRSWPQTTRIDPLTTIVMHAQTRRAPWTPRIQAGFLVMEKPVTYVQVKTGLTVSTPPGWLLLYEGSLTYGTVNENDIWASADNGATWDLIAGVTRFGSGGYHLAHVSDKSFRGRAASSQCEDPTNDDVFSLGGTLPGEGPSNDVWYSSDAITWSLHGTGVRSFSPGRSWTSCDVDDHGVMYVMGGLVEGTTPSQNRLLNDVWWGTNQGRSWTKVSSEDVGDYDTMWSPRAEHSVLLYHSHVLKKDLLYVMGGWTKYTPPTYETVNDVWVSSDGGVTWAELTGLNSEDGPTSNMWSKRWGHAAVITEEGVLLVIGGADSKTRTQNNTISYHDMWASFDGGYNWYSCKLPPAVDFIRTEQAAQLTADEHLLLASGYSYANGSRRIDFSDVFISNISMSDPEVLANICGGEEALPTAGAGLRVWPGTGSLQPANTGVGMSGVAISGIVFSILITVAVLAYCVSGYKRTGFWPIPAFLGGTAPSSAVLDTTGGSTDYSAFSFGDKADLLGPAGTHTNGNGTNGKEDGDLHTQHNSQFLS